MADQNDLRPPRVEGTQVAGAQVPDLIERYRVRRDAWIAQADELARLRDEVRGAAEREAMEIVTAARRDVRQVIMEARRELLVLSAQVQAALGEVAGKPDPAALLKAHAASSNVAAAGLSSSATGDHPADILVPEAAVKTMLDEARADMEALAQDARTVPFESTTIASHFPSEPPSILLRKPASFELPAAPPTFESTQPKVVLETVPPHAFEAAAAASSLESHDVKPTPAKESAERPFVSSIQFESIASLPSMSTTASRVLLSSPFPSDSVPVPSGRSVRAFVALFVAAGVVVLGGSVWWLRAPSTSSSNEATAAPAASNSPVAAANAPSASAASAAVVRAKENPLPLALVVEAKRQSWIRTTVDGESDPGRTYAAGETLQLNARHGISLRVGDAGAVYVSVNKGEATPLGQAGQVMTKQFVAEAGSSSAPGAPVPSAPVPAAPKPVAPPASVPTASARPSLPLPVPLVQSAAPQNAAAIDPTPSPAVGRRDAAPAALPRTESAAVASSQPTVPSVAAPAAAPPPATVSAPASNGSPATAVVAAARQWLDAYHRQERSTMAALSTENLQLADERRAEERFPAGADVNRSLDRVSVQIAADTAVLTAVMTERGDAGAQRVSPISQVWILSGGQWRVKQVRLVSEARLNQIFR
jgi:hypothetical protein